MVPDVDLVISKPHGFTGRSLELEFCRFVFVRPPFGITFCCEIDQTDNHVQRWAPIVAKKSKEWTFVVKRRIHIICFQVEAVILGAKTVMIRKEPSLRPVEQTC